MCVSAVSCQWMDLERREDVVMKQLHWSFIFYSQSTFMSYFILNAFTVSFWENNFIKLKYKDQMITRNEI